MQALAEGLRPGCGPSATGVAAAKPAPKSVVTSMAGFADAVLAMTPARDSCVERVGDHLYGRV
jgi:hypothetical protein